MLPDDHSRVDPFARIDEQHPALLQIKQGVMHRLAISIADESPVSPALDGPPPRAIPGEQPVHNAAAARVGQELAVIADQTTARDVKGQPSLTASGRAHVTKLALTSA